MPAGEMNTRGENNAITAASPGIFFSAPATLNEAAPSRTSSPTCTPNCTSSVSSSSADFPSANCANAPAGIVTKSP